MSYNQAVLSLYLLNYWKADYMSYILLMIVGLAAGFFGSLVGLGGGIIIVPILLFLSYHDGQFYHTDNLLKKP